MSEMLIGDRVITGTETVDYRKSCIQLLEELVATGKINKTEQESIFVLAKSKLGNGGFWRDLYNYITNNSDMDEKVENTFLSTIGSNISYANIITRLRSITEKYNLIMHSLEHDCTSEMLIDELTVVIDKFTVDYPESLDLNYLNSIKNELKLQLIQSDLFLILLHVKTEIKSL